MVVTWWIVAFCPVILSFISCKFVTFEEVGVVQKNCHNMSIVQNND